MKVLTNGRTVRVRLFSFLILLSVTYAVHLFGEEAEKTKRSGFTVLPGIWYTPETKFAGGGQVMYYFRSEADSKSRLSILPAGIAYTQKKQIAIGINPDFYLKAETYRLMGEMSYSKFPDKFYGIGNQTSEEMEEDYTPRMFRVGGILQRKIRSRLNIGIKYRFEDTAMKEVEQSGLLAQGSIVGSEDGVTSGIGFLANWDDRDNPFYTTKGGFYQISTTFFNGIMGSDYDFTQLNLDFRRFFSTLPSHTLAFQANMNFTDGDVPFRDLSQLGGGNLLRGYLLGRFRDRHLLIFQMEYRVMPVWRRVGIVGFLGFGQVADTPDNFKLNDFKYSIGWGFRYQINREEGINLKIDVGYGKGSSGLYIGIGEAF
ncbi:MAG: BamA/TamA family outer membrane protein [Candidatus Poribacteria bacterium]|nr:BamA/TamA family outer membrane protein [Candidatus Poribacteria bacterium]